MCLFCCLFTIFIWSLIHMDGSVYLDLDYINRNMWYLPAMFLSIHLLVTSTMIASRYQLATMMSNIIPGYKIGTIITGKIRGKSLPVLALYEHKQAKPEHISWVFYITLKMEVNELHHPSSCCLWSNTVAGVPSTFYWCRSFTSTLPPQSFMGLMALCCLHRRM